jgi:Signal transduction histidine kinase
MLFQPPVSQLSIVFFISAVLSLTVAGLAWRHPTRTDVTDWFLVVITTDAAWALLSIIPLEAGVASVAFAGQVSSVAASNVSALAWFIFSLVYIGRKDVLTRRRLVLLTLPMVVSFIGFATAPFHSLSISDVTVTVRPTATVLSYQLAPLSNLGAVYILSLVTAGTGLIAWTALTDPDLYADQTVGLLVGGLTPIAGIALTVSGVFEIGATNITPATIWIAAIGYGYAIFGADLLETGPGVAAQGEDIAIERLSEGFLVVDSRGVIIEANTAAHELIDDGPLTNQSLTSILEIEELPASGQHRFRFDRGQILEAQVTPIDPDDLGENDGHVLTLRDVTARERRQERLQVLNRVLRHNVRTELDVVRAHAEQIPVENTAQISSAEVSTQIIDSVDTLLSTAEKARTVEQLLAADGESPQESVALTSLLLDCAATKRSAAESTNINTALPTECSIRSDQDVLHLVINELLDNAVQHTGDGATVWIRVEGGDSASIEITDDGPGIPQQEREAVLDGTESELGHASHFGLWMVRWGVLYLGGDFSIRDRQPTGTAVEITLPP